MRKWYTVMSRCDRPGRPDYAGVKCLITPDDIHDAWRRDNADAMKHPSIDRIDPDGNYTPDNIRIVELRDNVRARRKRKE